MPSHRRSAALGGCGKRLGDKRSRTVAAIRHEPEYRAFDCNVRQLLHVGFKFDDRQVARPTNRLLPLMWDDFIRRRTWKR